MNITSIVVILNTDVDYISLNTDLPSVFGRNSTLDLTFYTPGGVGERYVRENFPGIPISVVGIGVANDGELTLG